MRGKARTVNLIEGSIWKGLILFSLPLMASNLFQQFYNTMDSLVVGQFVGSTALAAVGSTGSLSFLVIGFFMGFGTGSGVIIAQHYGAKEPEEVSGACNIFRHCFGSHWNFDCTGAFEAYEYAG